MNKQLAKENWRNFFRQMVGLPKIYPVKVKRSEEAKKYPLIQIKKHGDVGYDICATETVVVPPMSSRARAQYTQYKMAIAEQEKKLITADSDALVERYERNIENLKKAMYDVLPRVMIPTGIKLEMSDNIWCTVEARSSASGRFLITPDSIIDSGYRGEFFAIVFNIGYEPQTIKAGERVCQLVFHEKVLIDPVEVDELSKSDRGEGGFGSTGK